MLFGSGLQGAGRIESTIYPETGTDQKTGRRQGMQRLLSLMNFEELV